MNTITKKQIFKEHDRTHTQIVSIDFEDNFMTIQHNGEEIALSANAFNKLLKLYNEALNERKQEKTTLITYVFVFLLAICFFYLVYLTLTL